MKFRIAHKGLLLVVVPLILELVLFASLIDLLRQAEDTAKVALHSRQILASLNALTSDVVQLYKNLNDERRLKALKQEDIKELVDNLGRDMFQVTEAVKDDPKFADWNTSVKKSTAEMHDKLQEIFDAYARNDDFDKIIPLVKKNRALWRKYLVDSATVRLLAIANEEKEIEESEPQKQAELRHKVKTLLFAGLALNVLVAIALAIFFSRQISRRLAIIKDNNARLLAGQPLHGVVSGSDEIADVDQAFHAMTDELRASRQREQAAQRLRDQVVAMVTHDVRSPLQTVSTFLDIVDKRITEEPIRELLHVAERNVNRMERLTSDLLDMEKLRAGKLELEAVEFPMSAAIDEAKESVLSVTESKKITVTSSGDCTVTADKHRIVQVLTNLISNAVKFSPDGGTIEVAVHRDGSKCAVDVTDHGRGIPADKIALIFDDFAQSQAADATTQGGFGLGLGISKSLVELHHGTISVKSVEGEGSTFSIVLPITPGETAHGQNSAS